MAIIPNVDTPSVQANLASIAERFHALETNLRLAVQARDDARDKLDAARERIDELEDIALELRGEIAELRGKLAAPKGMKAIANPGNSPLSQFNFALKGDAGVFTEPTGLGLKPFIIPIKEDTP